MAVQPSKAIEPKPAEFDIVITDLHLPGADGFDVLKTARSMNPSCQVVVITGAATIDSAVRAKKGRTTIAAILITGANIVADLTASCRISTRGDR
jgi:DNA-binding NtrC family response regulator